MSEEEFLNEIMKKLNGDDSQIEFATQEHEGQIIVDTQDGSWFVLSVTKGG